MEATVIGVAAPRRRTVLLVLVVASLACAPWSWIVDGLTPSGRLSDRPARRPLADAPGRRAALLRDRGGHLLPRPPPVGMDHLHGRANGLPARRPRHPPVRVGGHALRRPAAHGPRRLRRLAGGQALRRPDTVAPRGRREAPMSLNKRRSSTP